MTSETAKMFLQTERLIQRRFREEDFDDFCALAVDEERNRMIGNAPVTNEDEAQTFFAYMKDREPRAYALVLKETGRAVGNLTVYDRFSFEDHPALAGLTGRELSFSVARAYCGA